MEMGSRGRLVAPLLFAAIVVATLAVLVLSQRARTRLVVDQIELTNSFRPAQGDAARIRFRLTEDEASGTVEVIDADDMTVDVLAEDEPLGDFEIHRFSWDGGEAEEGVYRVRLTLDSLGREIVLPEQIDLKPGRARIMADAATWALAVLAAFSAGCAFLARADRSRALWMALALVLAVGLDRRRQLGRRAFPRPARPTPR